MEFEKRITEKGSVAIVTSLQNCIEDAGDFLDVMASGESDTIVLHRDHLVPEFFNLKTGILGDVLQKVSNYRRKLVILGDWSEVPGKSLGDFIRESNRGGQVVFAADVEAGLAALR